MTSLSEFNSMGHLRVVRLHWAPCFREPHGESEQTKGDPRPTHTPPLLPHPHPLMLETALKVHENMDISLNFVHVFFFFLNQPLSPFNFKHLIKNTQIGNKVPACIRIVMNV